MENDHFYEVMSATANPYAFSEGEEFDSFEAGVEPQQRNDEAKLTAIITLILTAIVAIALGVLFLRGIDAIKSTAPTQSDSSGTLEL